MLVDWRWMRHALDLAERGRGHVEPNPMVGAVVVRGGHSVGEGWHQRYGEAHAEVHALNAAGESARGAVLYLTLEPCCHHGKTPPCTDAILRAGITRVVAAMPDPFPLVCGRGADILRAARVAVEFGLGEEEARRLNAPYLTLLSKGRPYIHLKWAMTLDGKIATRTGDSKWISGEGSRRRVHELRGRMDAVLVGIGTVLADDPLLTARPPGPRTAARIVLDSRGRLPLSSQIVKTAQNIPVVAAVCRLSSAPDELRRQGCEVLELPEQDERVSLAALLAELGKRRMTNLLVEGGAGVLGSFLDERLADEVHVFIAPRLAGGAAALPPISGIGAGRIADALPLKQCAVERIEEDTYIHGLL